MQLLPRAPLRPSPSTFWRSSRGLVLGAHPQFASFVVAHAAELPVDWHSFARRPCAIFAQVAVARDLRTDSAEAGSQCRHKVGLKYSLGWVRTLRSRVNSLLAPSGPSNT